MDLKQIDTTRAKSEAMAIYFHYFVKYPILELRQKSFVKYIEREGERKKGRKEGNVKTGLNLHKGCSDCWRWLNVMKINK